jgi:hypothetical protein
VAFEDRQLMPQRNALPNQRSTGSMIFPRSFNDVATRPDHWQSLCRTGIVCQRFRVGPGFEEGQEHILGFMLDKAVKAQIPVMRCYSPTPTSRLSSNGAPQGVYPDCFTDVRF